MQQSKSRPSIALFSEALSSSPASARTKSQRRKAVSGSAMATKLPLSSLFLLLVLLLSVAWMPPKASAQPRTCSIELDSTGCRPQDCVARCAAQYRGIGECAHQEYVSNFHCVCLYACL
ncbi:putative defensin-like protein 157 [Eucalyptus grandis]|uniref:Uncharacterized protein n=3 Tax=Eucalyptus TaxID=3932 RepID=A0A059A2T2_EUCGR|nr:putative defensin-like protein 157 [Eucalyptus grandis]KAK3405626.1 hypothetical protein EUGRSUZ_K01859 [Eucalyptus grandis]